MTNPQDDKNAIFNRLNHFKAGNSLVQKAMLSFGFSPNWE
jgi:hypothetical protein